ncbi:MAG: Rho termination factor domain protein [Gemmatales bacterium]|nr:MAG: Rho termination factor domain protein [Gemmatales bacterium]
MTKDQLRGLSKKKLEELARKHGVDGWYDLRKEELVNALFRKTAGKKSSTPRASKTTQSTRNTRSRRGQATSVRTQKAAARNSSNGGDDPVERSKFELGVPTRDLSAKVPKDLPGGYGKDRIVVMVRDPYWLHAYWELTRKAIQRAEAALGQDWHLAKPILRVLKIANKETTATAEAIVRDIQIHGGCNNWYIDVSDPPSSFRVDIGYLAPNGRFYVLARSNVVSTPRAGVSDLIDENWADFDHKKADRIYAMSGGFDPTASSLELKELFEERLRRPLGSPAVTSFGSGAYPPGKERKFWFHLDAELIVYGATEPNARVTLQGEPIKLRPDGTFTMRYSLPDSRQIIPAVSTSADGVEERTIVLAVERNTKQLEPLVHDLNNE